MDPELNTGMDTGSTPIDTGVDTGDSHSDVSNERPTIRESLKDGFARARERAGIEDDGEEVEKPAVRKRTPRSRASELRPDPTQAATGVEGGQPQAGSQSVEAPRAWNQEAKAAWAQVPPAAQAAVLKREQDVERGVQALRQHYGEIDKALAPHLDEIKRLGKTPGQTIHHLFNWFKALGENPVEAVPALFQTLKYNPEVLNALAKKFGLVRAAPPGAQQQRQQPVNHQQILASHLQHLQSQGATQEQLQQYQQNYIQTVQQQYAAEQQRAQQQNYIHPDVVKLLKAQHAEIMNLKKQTQTFGREFGGIKNNFARQSFAKTQEALNVWAKDKPFFEEVRVRMGQLLTPDPNTGRAVVPLKNGRVDLEAAYDAAVWSMPEVRAKALAAQQAAQAEAAKKKARAERDAQQAQASQAARRNVTITSTAPGAVSSTRPGAQRKGMSVRESLTAAMKQHSGNI